MKAVIPKPRFVEPQSTVKQDGSSLRATTGRIFIHGHRNHFAASGRAVHLTGSGSVADRLSGKSTPAGQIIKGQVAQTEPVRMHFGTTGNSLVILQNLLLPSQNPGVGLSCR